jgi:GNAT superfamily N-acetyltransferase
MEIRLATVEDFDRVRQYDRHIPEERVRHCLEMGQVDALWDGDRVMGILRWSLFWQTMPFVDLIFLDDACRGREWGSKMMARWEKNIRAEGYDYGMTSTQADETAKFFYEKLGYQRIGAFLPPDQEADELIYGKELSV